MIDAQITLNYYIRQKKIILFERKKNTKKKKRGERGGSLIKCFDRKDCFIFLGRECGCCSARCCKNQKRDVCV